MPFMIEEEQSTASQSATGVSTIGASTTGGSTTVVPTTVGNSTRDGDSTVRPNLRLDIFATTLSPEERAFYYESAMGRPPP
ncbi:hypothetical protein L204_105667 [Cryptococcus depauperatus]|nr:hypothetical protein L204_02565 [Cryptococcus depauperatus CBS 7855]